MQVLRLAIAVSVILAVLTAAATALAKKDDDDAGFKTERPPQLVATESGVAIDPILSVGDTVDDYQMSGIPDGLGAFSTDADDGDAGDARRSRDRGEGNDESLQVLMNHELAGSAPAGVGARISQLSLNLETLGVTAASYPVDGSEGFSRFCSARLEEIGGRQLYFTGEEATETGGLTADPNDGIGHGGSSIVLDGETGEWTETPHFGLLPHENNVPVQGLKQAMIFVTEDGNPAGNKSQLYAYIAPSFSQAIAGSAGSLYVWTADPGQGQDADPSTDDIAEGETLEGQFVPVSQAENADAASLEAAAQAKGAFDFVRLEDAAVSQTHRGDLYMADTGAAGSESVRGRMYHVDVNRKDPTQASVTLILDGDRQATGSDPVKMVNPDNIDTSKRSVVIQEDRNSEHRDAAVEGGYGRILVYDIKTGGLRAVARVDTPSGLRPGEWESSGVINAFDLLGRHMWLLDVQGHAQTAPQPGPSLVPDSSSGEDGQLLAIRIPGS